MEGGKEGGREGGRGGRREGGRLNKFHTREKASYQNFMPIQLI